METIEDFRNKEEFKTLNRDFYFVFQPKEEFIIKTKGRRFLIGAWMLPNYIGKKNAFKLIEATKNLSKDKHSFKYRKFGRVDIYFK